jgi:hypothetical protein
MKYAYQTMIWYLWGFIWLHFIPGTTFLKKSCQPSAQQAIKSILRFKECPESKLRDETLWCTDNTWMENSRYLKVVIGKGFVGVHESYVVGKLPVFNIVFLQLHIHGTTCVLFLIPLWGQHWHWNSVLLIWRIWGSGFLMWRFEFCGMWCATGSLNYHSMIYVTAVLLSCTDLWDSNNTYCLYSVVSIATSYGLDNRGVGSLSPGRAKNFLFAGSSRPALRPTQPPIQWVPGALSQGVKRPGREADQSRPISAKVKKMWICTYITLNVQVIRFSMKHWRAESISGYAIYFAMKCISIFT